MPPSVHRQAVRVSVSQQGYSSSGFLGAVERLERESGRVRTGPAGNQRNGRINAQQVRVSHVAIAITAACRFIVSGCRSSGLKE